MKVLFINTVVDNGSTGRITRDLANGLKAEGHNVLICYGRGTPKSQEDTFFIGNTFSTLFHVAMTRFFGRHGLHSTNQTKKLISKIEEFKPDIIHLHNIHGYYLNYKVLFEYLSNQHIKILWTLHDCWTITGSSAYFEYKGCKVWDDGCVVCNSTTDYPTVWGVKRQRKNFYLKKRLFTSLNDLTVITPSNWLKDIVDRTFLGEHPTKVINNGININIFRNYKDKLFLDKYGLSNKFIILGVANVWDERKGLNYFCELSKSLLENEIIVLVGLTRKQIKGLPPKIIGIEKTRNIDELVILYSSADVFVNPTLEDNFPTVNLEAMACGTPIITFPTGGSVEVITSRTGIVTEDRSSAAIRKAINTMRINKKEFYIDECEMRARKLYNNDAKINEYIKEYELYRPQVKNEQSSTSHQIGL